MVDPRTLLHQTRRHFFRHCGVGLGAMALARCSARAARRASADLGRRPAGAPKPHFPAEGEERHLPVHGRRAEPARAVRPQAEAPGAPRPADPRVVHQGQAVRLHGHLRQGAAEAPGDDAEVRPARPVRGLGLGVPAAPRQGRRRRRRRPIGGDRRLQPRPGQAVHQHRLAAVRPAEHGLVGHLRPRQRVAATCPASSCCSPARAARAAGRSLGRAASCRRRTRACRSGPAASRSST